MDNNSTISGDSHTSTRDSRTTTNKRGRGDMCGDSRHSQQPSSESSSMGEERLLATNSTTASTKAIQQQQQPKEKTSIPCLDCLGDSKQTRPEQICRSANIKQELQRLRLRHCCERDVYTALHGKALAEVLSGGAACERHLQDLIQTDALATRITCEFTEILVRYDCRQMYSIIHHCEDCKVRTGKAGISIRTDRLINGPFLSLQEAYRRWVCSTLIPYFDFVNNTDSKANQTAAALGISSSAPVVKRSVSESAAAAATEDDTEMTIVDDSSEPKKRLDEDAITATRTT